MKRVMGICMTFLPKNKKQGQNAPESRLLLVYHFKNRFDVLATTITTSMTFDNVLIIVFFGGG